MGKATGLLKELSGKIGPLQFQQTKSGKVAVYVAPEVPETPLRTKAQGELRMAWGNLGAVYTQFHKTLRRVMRTCLRVRVTTTRLSRRTCG